MEFSQLINKTFLSVERNGDNVSFISNKGEMYVLGAEDGPPNDVNVFIESITGDLNDLVGKKLVKAEESSNKDNSLNPQYTWTFYKFATSKGYVDIRFCGESNGYYCEKATLSDLGIVDISHFNQPTKNKRYNI